MFGREVLQSTESLLRNTAVGIRVLSFGRLERALSHDRYLEERLFTQEEREYCKGRIYSLAGRLAAKFSVRQVLHAPVPWQEVSTIPLPTGQPVVVLTGSAAELAQQKGIQDIAVSISHDEGYSAAIAVPTTDLGDRKKVGIDLTSLRRMAQLCDRFNPHLRTRIFTPAEVKDAAGNVARLAQKWGVKESVLKILCHGAKIRLADIESISSGKSRLTISLRNAASIYAEQQGLHTWEVMVTPCYGMEMAVVTAYSRTIHSQPQPNQT